MKKTLLKLLFTATLAISLSINVNPVSAEPDPNSFQTSTTMVYIDGNYYFQINCLNIPSWMCNSPGSTWYIKVNGMVPW